MRPEVAVLPQSVKLDIDDTAVTEHQWVSGLVASVIALVGSWKILLHTPIDPPTAGTAASSRQTAQEVTSLPSNLKNDNVLLLSGTDEYRLQR